MFGVASSNRNQRHSDSISNEHFQFANVCVCSQRTQHCKSLVLKVWVKAVGSRDIVQPPPVARVPKKKKHARPIFSPNFLWILAALQAWSRAEHKECVVPITHIPKKKQRPHTVRLGTLKSGRQPGVFPLAWCAVDSSQIKVYTQNEVTTYTQDQLITGSFWQYWCQRSIAKLKWILSACN